MKRVAKYYLSFRDREEREIGKVQLEPSATHVLPNGELAFEMAEDLELKAPAGTLIALVERHEDVP